MNLEPIDPETALELYLAEKETEAAKATIDSHRSRLGFFLRWCDERDIENLNELTGRRLHEFRLWRRNVGELSKAGEKTQMDTVRVFVRWLESIDAVEQDLHLKVRSPNVTADENTREVMLDADDAKPMLEYYSRYEYASLPHVTVSLLWHTMRDRRPDVTDIHDRRPLLATAQGRIAGSTIRKYCYQCTRPCVYGDGCPHDRNPDDCDANEPDNASHCPSSVSPHAFRRGSITHYLNSDVPETAVSDQANVSQEVLDQHYDQRSKRDKMQQRRKYLDNI